MGFLDVFGRLFGPSPVKASKATSGTFLSSVASRASLHEGPPRREGRAILESYGKIPRFRGPVHRIAQSVASIEWKVGRIKGGIADRRSVLHRLQSSCFTKDIFSRQRVLRKLVTEGDIEIISSGHPALSIIQRGVVDPNGRTVLSGSEVRKVIQIYLDTVGECYLICEINRSGQVVQIRPIPPHWHEQGPSEKRDSFIFNNGSGWRFTVDSKLVIHLKDVDPLDPYGHGRGTGSSLATELDIGEYSAQTMASFFFNNAMPESIVTFEGMQADGIEAHKAKWLNEHRGAFRRGMPHFTNAKVDVQQLSPRLVDMGLDEIRNSVSDTTREAYGMPPEILGKVENSNRATIDAADLIFSRYVLEPRLAFLEEMFNLNLVPKVDKNSNIVLFFVSPVADDQEFLKDLYVAAPHAFTVNEVRCIAQMKPWDGEQGDLVALDNSTKLVQRSELGKDTNEDLDTEEPESVESEEDTDDEENGKVNSDRSSKISVVNS